MSKLRHPTAAGAVRVAFLLGSIASIALVAAVAWAFFTTTGHGTGSGTLSTLATPSAVSGTPSGSTVAVAWTGVASPAGGNTNLGYWVQRYLGSTPTNACGSSQGSPIAAPTHSCNDTSVPDGTYTYTVTAVFRSWTAASGASSSVIVDATPPTLTVHFPASSGNYNASIWDAGAGLCSSSVCGTASDSGTGVANIKVSIRQGSGNYWNGTSFSSGSEVLNLASGTTTWQLAFAHTKFPADGSYTVRVIATDNASNTTSVSRTFTYDNIPPAGGSVDATGLVGTGSRYSASTTLSIAFTKGTDSGSGLAATGAKLTRASALVSSSNGLINGTCGAYGSFAQVGPTDPTSPFTDNAAGGIQAGHCYQYQYVVSDNAGNTITYTSGDIKVDTTAPSAPAVSVSAASGNTFINGTTVYTNPQTAKSGGFTASATTTDNDSGISKVNFPALTGFTSGGGDVTSSPYNTTYAWSGAGATATGSKTVTATNNATLTNTGTFTVTPDTTAPTGGALTVNSVGASGVGTSSYNTTGSFTIGTRTDYTETQSATQSGLTSSTLTRQPATLGNNACGSFGSTTTLTGNPSQSGLATGCYLYTLTGTDNVGNTTTISTTVMVDTTTPTTPGLAFSGLSANAFYNSGNNTLYIRPSSGGTFTVTATSTDPDSSVKTGNAGYTFSSLVANNFTLTQTGGQASYTFGASATAPGSNPTVFATNNAGNNSANASYSIVVDTTAPTGGALTVNSVAASPGGSTSSTSSTSFTIGTRTNYTETQNATQSGLASSTLTIQSETLTGGVCGAPGSGGPYTSPTTIIGTTNPAVTAGFCYLYTLTGIDNVGNTTSVHTTVTVTAAQSMHISALSFGSVTTNNNNWGGTLTVTVVDQNGAALTGVTVTGSWSPTGGAQGNCSAVTNASGQCTVIVSGNPFPQSAETWTPSNLTKSSYAYNSAANNPASISVPSQT